MKIWKVLGLTAVAAASLYALTACATKPDPMDDKATASITSYNHTPDYIHQFYVNGTWGGNSFAYGGGGSFVCCLVYPKTWRPGLTAKVKWTTSSSDPNAEGDAAKEHWHEAIIPIERYVEEADTLNVHFLPEGKVRLIISNKGPGQRSYPGPSYPVKPADFHFAPSRRAAREAEERVRAQAEGRAQAEAEMRALKGASVPQARSTPPSQQGSILPPPPVAPKDEK
ncbi:DUF3304 domain-containing protein [Ralstonia holmesii]|uniref:DUF3304 domain-containing protein n=1 Tax=Ralstonia holmesii TaxID=3058602 RepID=A0ABC8Q5K0_9RALS|nr:DUF3304 domain-containing protein [Ralstonia sp. LMG 32967]CAJ0773714.1 hypothetical protein LMG18096_00013 [Ralstonia sp. LMG 32967]CAJ0820164.1 hypothetical protein LMG18093_04274 [Ralstonia sp. LMG 32967]